MHTYGFHCSLLQDQTKQAQASARCMLPPRHGTVSSWDGAASGLQQQRDPWADASENPELRGPPRWESGSSLEGDRACLQVQRWSAEELSAATDEELWQASTRLAQEAYRFAAQQSPFGKVTVLFKKDVKQTLTQTSVAGIRGQESLRWCECLDADSSFGGDLASFEHLPHQATEASELWAQTEQMLQHVQEKCSSPNAATQAGRLAREHRNLQQDLFDFHTRISRWQAMSKDLHARALTAAEAALHPAGASRCAGGQGGV